VSEVVEQLIGKIVMKLASEAGKGAIYAAVAEAIRGFPSSKARTLSEEEIKTIARAIAEISRSSAQPIDEAKLREIIRSELQRALRQ
jgi:ribosomal protein S13